MNIKLNLNEITPTQWVDLTRETTTSRQEGAHKYIIIDKNNRVYLSTDLKTIEKGDRKLSLADIVFISKQIIEKNIKSLEERSLTTETSKEVRDYKEISQNIINNAQSLISSKDEKYRFLRALLCLITLGAALLFIKKSERQLETKMDEMIASVLDTTIRANRLEELVESVQTVMQRYEEYELGFDDAKKLVRLMSSDPSQKERFELIPSTMKKYDLGFDDANKLVGLMQSDPGQMERFELIPPTMKEYGLNFDDASTLAGLMKGDESQVKRSEFILSAMEEYQLDFDGASKLVKLMIDCPDQMKGFENPTLIQSVIQGTIDDLWIENNNLPVDERPAILMQFSKDIGRGMSLKRKDEALNVEDKDPLPPLSLPLQQRITDAADAIGEIVRGNEKDQKWASVLQLLATQSSLNGAFFGPRVVLNVSGSEITWSEGSVTYALSAEFPNQLPPIEIEIVRNQETSDIEKVNVKVVGGLDLVKKQMGEGELENQTLFPGAVSVSMSYTVTLRENGAPALSDLQCEYQTSLPYTLE